MAWEMTDNNLILLKQISYWVCGVENVKSDLKARFSEILLFKVNIKRERK
jgi:hypothetical protein